jgi:nitroreductase
MDVFEAINSRFACRQFIDRPVDLDIVRDLIHGAARAASSLNLQPWNVYAVTGEPLREIVRRVFEAIAQKGWRTFATEYRECPETLWEPYHSRRFDFGSQLYGALGIN